MTMTGLKMIQVGTDVHDNPVYNVIKEDGKLATTTIMTEAEAQAMISGEDKVVEAVVEELEEDLSHIPDYKGMGKKKLEETMRSYGIELDRRKSKSALLKEVEMFFSGYFT